MFPRPFFLLAASLFLAGCKTPIKVMDDLTLQQFEKRVDYRKGDGLVEMWEDLGVKSDLFMRDREVRMTRQNINATEDSPGFVIYLATSNLKQEYQYLVFRREINGAIRFLGVAEVKRQLFSEPTAELSTKDKKPTLTVKHKAGQDRYDLSGLELKKL